MILISKTTTGILIQRDELDIQIEHSAVSTALPAIIATLIDNGRALANARLSGYEAGLIQGRINAGIEYATSARIAERQADDLVESLVGIGMATAA